MITLSTDRLRVTLSEPGEAPNSGFRFDRAGFISDIVLDGIHRFCASEPFYLPHPCSGGRGLCSEFLFDASGQAGPKDSFPKFGVGLLQKEGEERYVFYKKYRSGRLFSIAADCSQDRAIFVTKPQPCLGYALCMKKAVTVSGTTITVETTVENVGERQVTLEEYCHNFLTIDGMALGPGYRLSMPSIPNQGTAPKTGRDGNPTFFLGCGKGLTFDSFSPAPAGCTIGTENLDAGLPFCWQLSYGETGAFVSGRDYFVPSRIYVWAADHMVCPEIFHQFTLPQGCSHSWTRAWSFDVR